MRNALNQIKAHRNEIVAGAVTWTLYHVVGLDFGQDVEKVIHHEVAHLAINLRVVLAFIQSAFTFPAI